ncbi:MAG: DNA-binding NarL/FixJ family response regulator [Cellvibrionaceae bacterium]|jgi:DNA-binding NarL/FixJ family response regulator
MSTKDPIYVVLADDHAMVRAGIKQFIEKTEEIQVVYQALNGQEVLDYLSTKHADTDVVVLDIKMPILNGIETTKVIRSTYPDIGVLILSAFDDDPYVTAVLAIGAHGYMLKSATPLELIAAVKSINMGQSALSPAIAQKIMGQFSSEIVVPLTEREIEMLLLLKDGKTNKEIGGVKGISSRTVQSHLANIYRKLDVANRTEALSRATSLGLIHI